jgi:hypothetical protein
VQGVFQDADDVAGRFEIGESVRIDFEGELGDGRVAADLAHRLPTGHHAKNAVAGGGYRLPLRLDGGGALQGGFGRGSAGGQVEFDDDADS